MEKIHFTKMEGAGNDYIYINLFESSLSKPEALAREITHRRYGVGSDGLVLIGPSTSADVQMIMYNLDGSLSEMCGNALRCVGKFVWDRGLVKRETMKIETGAGVKEVTVQLNDQNRVETVSTSMGIPELNAAKIPSTLSGDAIVDQLFDFGDFSLKGTLVSMGNPHLVTYVDDVQSVPIEKWGTAIENSSYFPNRINIEFVQVISRTVVKQRTWERGCQETWACGTGAAAVGVAGVLTQKCDSDILIHLTGGDLRFSWPGGQSTVTLVGPAREVFTGVFHPS